MGLVDAALAMKMREILLSTMKSCEWHYALQNIGPFFPLGMERFDFIFRHMNSWTAVWGLLRPSKRRKSDLAKVDFPLIVWKIPHGLV